MDMVTEDQATYRVALHPNAMNREYWRRRMHVADPVFDGNDSPKERQKERES